MPANMVVGPRGRGRLAFTLSLAGVCGLMGWWLWRPLNIYDEGLILTGAQRIAAGEVLHADFWRLYPVGGFLGPLASDALFGVSVPSARLPGVLGRLAVVVVLGIITTRVAGWWAGSFMVAVGGVAMGATVAQLYPLHPGTLCLLIAVGLLSIAQRSHGRRQWLLATLAGVAAGVAGVFRQDLAVIGTVVLAGLLAVAWMREGGAGGGRSMFLGFCAGGAVSGLSVLAVLVAWSGAAPVWDQLIWFPLARMPAARGLPWPTPSLDNDAILFYVLIVAVSLIGVDVARIVWRGAGTDGAGSPALLDLGGLAVVGLGLWVLALRRFDTTHCTPAAVVAVAVLIGAALRRPRVATTWRMVNLVTAVVVACAVVLGPATSIARAVLGRSASGPARTCAELPPAAGCVPLSPDQLAAITEVRRITGPLERIYVGVTRHSRVNVGDSSLYFLAGRLPGVSHDEIHPGVTDTPEVQKAIIAELERNRVRVVVTVDLPDSQEPNLSAVDSGVTLLDDFLREEFRTACRSGRYEVRVRSLPPEGPTG